MTFNSDFSKIRGKRNGNQLFYMKLFFKSLHAREFDNEMILLNLKFSVSSKATTNTCHSSKVYNMELQIIKFLIRE